jgi:hypothetical protein
MGNVNHSEIEKLIEIEKKLYCEAYENGLSVANICRRLGFKDWDRVYRVIRRNKLVPSLPTRQRFSIPDVLAGTFKAVKHSFPMWCAGHGLDLKIAEYALNSNPYEATDPGSKKVFAALKEDFHNLYEKMYGSDNMFNMTFSDFDESTRSRFCCHINWIESEDVYLAVIPELTDVKATGSCWDSALANLKMLFNIKRRIIKLESMVERTQT